MPLRPPQMYNVRHLSPQGRSRSPCSVSPAAYHRSPRYSGCHRPLRRPGASRRPRFPGPAGPVPPSALPAWPAGCPPVPVPPVFHRRPGFRPSRRTLLRCRSGIPPRRCGGTRRSGSSRLNDRRCSFPSLLSRRSAPIFPSPAGQT